LAAIGEGLQNLAVALNQRDKAKAQAYFAEASSTADLDLAKILEDSKKNALPGADGFPKTYLSKFDKYKEKAISNAPGQREKELMAAHLARTREAYGLQAMKFENEEGYRHMGEQFDKGVDTSSKIVSLTPELFERELGKFTMTAEQMAATPEQRAALKEIARSKLAMNAVTGSIDRNPSGDNLSGKAYDLLTTEEQAKVKHYANQKKNEFKAQKMASLFIDVSKEVVNTAPMMAGDLIDLPKAKAQALSVMNKNGVSLDGEQKLQLESYIERVASDRERDVKRKREVTTATLFAKLDQNGGDYQALVAENPWLENQPTEIKTRINNYAGVVATGGTKVTDWQAYNQLIDNPDLLKIANIDALSDKFNAKEKANLIKIQKALNDGMPEQNLIGTTSLVKKMLEDAGVKDDEKQGKMFSLLQSAIDQEIALTGKKQIPQPRIKELAADLLVDQIVKDKYLWFDMSTSTADLEIPETELPKIKEALIEAGMPISDYNIMQAYRNNLRNQKP